MWHFHSFYVNKLTYPDVGKSSTHNICTLYVDPLLLFISAWSQSWLHFIVLLPPTKNFCITPCLPILVELIDLVNSVMIVLSQVTLLRWLTYLLGSQTLILTVLLFWRYLFFLTLVFLKLGSGEFRGNASNLLNKGKSAILLYSTARRCCLLHLIKQNCLLKTFLGILILMIQVSPCMLSLLELIWNCIIFL